MLTAYLPIQHVGIGKISEGIYSKLSIVVNQETWENITVLLEYFKICTKLK